MTQDAPIVSGKPIVGYHLTDQSPSLAVLSIPTFEDNVTDDKSSQTTKSFTDAVSNFINISKQKGMQKLILDLQGNGGGSIFLGYDTFRQVSASIGSCHRVFS